MPRRLKVIFDKKTCIGNKACLAVDPERWENADDKVNLINGKKLKGDTYILEKKFSDDEAVTVIEGATVCPVNAIGVIDLDTGEEIVTMKVSDDSAKVIEAHYDDNKEFKLDPKGYFLIRVDRKSKKIEVGFCAKTNVVSITIKGNKPIDVYQTILKEKIIDGPDHAAYLGRELQKAYIALQLGIEYVQDDELDFKKKVK